MTDICRELEKLNIEFMRDLKLSTISTFKIGGNARLFVLPKNEYELSSTLTLIKCYNLRHEIIGNASNILFDDDGYEGVIVCTKSITGKIIINEDTITAPCGIRLSTLAISARDASLSGLEFAHGIPGTVGGAVAMNAGAYGGEMSDVVTSVFVLNKTTCKSFLLNANELSFGYRKSIFTENRDLIALLVNFKLRQGNKDEISAKMRENTLSRREKQPLELPSAGSYFKRPEGLFAAKLIDDCSLKGYKIGGASVSEKHAGFIVNIGNASSGDVLAVEEHVKAKVYEKFGVMLEREIKYIK